ncbi:hypothetical protein SEVIR_5G407000v4 [Setaria viridis]
MASRPSTRSRCCFQFLMSSRRNRTGTTSWSAV